jgi:hypothetical protein
LHLPQRPEIHRRCVMGASTNDPLRAGATDSKKARQIQANANHDKRREEEQRQAVPHVCSQPTPRVRRGRTTDIQQPLGQPGCGVGTSPTGQSFARGRSSHRLRLGRHSYGGGEELGIQVGSIYVEPTLAQPIQSACAQQAPHNSGGGQLATSERRTRRRPTCQPRQEPMWS